MSAVQVYDKIVYSFLSSVKRDQKQKAEIDKKDSSSTSMIICDETNMINKRQFAKALMNSINTSDSIGCVQCRIKNSVYLGISSCSTCSRL